jgi:hypothetical protein
VKNVEGQNLENGHGRGSRPTEVPRQNIRRTPNQCQATERYRPALPRYRGENNRSHREEEKLQAQTRSYVQESTSITEDVPDERKERAGTRKNHRKCDDGGTNSLASAYWPANLCH